VLFAEQFDSLRQSFGCEESMIESLARCVKWDNRGGKSGSGFLKTKGEGNQDRVDLCTTYRIIDDRFLAKELSKAELNAMETFAPAYFDYLATAVATGVRCSRKTSNIS
jgi:1-phosphatidylinositol-3-phosphate 5-kinase